MSDTDSSPDQLDLLFGAPGAAPSVPTAKMPAEASSFREFETELPSSEEARLRAQRRFYELLHSMTPVTWVTSALLVSNILVFIAMVAQGTSPWLPASEDLLKWGANYSPLTWGGQPWRLVSNLFIHCGVLHLAFNMWALWNIGRFLEKLIGNIGLVITYLVSGTLGSIASLWWNGDVVSAGASGAIFGLMGALASFLWNRTDSVPLESLTAMRGSIATCIFYNLLFGAAIEGIDQAAHVGGLFGGLICGFLLSQPLDQMTRQRRTSKNLFAAAVCALGLGTMVFLHPSPPPDFFLETQEYNEIVPRSLKEFAERAKKFDDDLLDRQTKSQEMESQLAKKQITPKDLAKWRAESAMKARQSRVTLANWLKDELLPPWRKIREHFESLSNVPAGRRDHLHQLRTALILREESWDLLIAALQRNDSVKWADFLEKQKQAEVIEEKLFSRE